MICRVVSVSLILGCALICESTDAVDVAKCALVEEGRATIITFQSMMNDGVSVKLEGILAGPTGAGPYPSIVMLPGGNGLVTPYCYGAVVKQFVSWGYVTLIVASTTAHDEHGVQRSQYSFADQVSHAYAAATAISSMEQIDSSRIAVWGHSLGGLSAIDAISRSTDRERVPFRAAVAIAPLCPSATTTPMVPLMVTIGENDTRVSVPACVDFAAALREIPKFEFLLLPNASHLYWVPGVSSFNESSALLAQRRINAFLQMHLGVPN